MSRARLPKVYLRLDPSIDAHPDHHAMVDLILWANRQPVRGYFRTLEKPLQLLGRKRLDAAIARRDLVEKRGRGWYLDGWEEWQEGDLTVGERVRRVRAKRERRNSTVTRPLPERNSPSVRSASVRSAKGMERTKKNPAGGGAAAGKDSTSPAAAAANNGTAWVQHDHGDEAHLRLVARCEQLAAMLAAQEEREPTDDDRREVLHAVTSTPKGKSIRTLKGATPEWVEESLRACDEFEADNKQAGGEPATEE